MLVAVLPIVLAATLVADDVIEAQIATALEDLQAYWLDADFSATAEAATAALQLIEASRCPWRQDAAIVSFIGGVTGSEYSLAAEPGYMFWVATRVHDRLNVFSTPLQSVAEARASAPGLDISLDQLFIHSAYRRPTVNESCPEPQLDPQILFAEVEARGDAFIAFGMPHGRFLRRRSPVSVVYAYPPGAGGQLGNSVIEAGDWKSPADEIAILTPSPCAVYFIEDSVRVEVCLDGADAAATQ